MRKFPTFIFDLDGVITNTEKYHYQAWKIICNDLGYNLTKEQNEELKGVSRNKCLLKILQWANLKISQSKFEALLNKHDNLLIFGDEKNEKFYCYFYKIQKKEFFHLN